MTLKVLISHAYNEKALAQAWKTLLEKISVGMIEVWFSSDTNAAGGVPIGTDWRADLYQKLDKSNLILAILTPESVNRPWIMWECGVASGINKDRGIIPIVYSMGRGALANPLSIYQAYEGEDADQVREVCMRLAQAADLRADLIYYDIPIQQYLSAVIAYHPPQQISKEIMDMWYRQFEDFVRAGRISEISPMRNLMYMSLGKQPLELPIHDLLSRILLGEREFRAAIEEVDYALRFNRDDLRLLHRKGLALVNLQNLQSAENLIRDIVARNPDASVNPEIASLEGRIHRERWERTKALPELDAAIAAYYRAYQADKKQYYPGVNAAELALTKGHVAFANQLLEEVLETCLKERQRSTVSFWVDFTLGPVYLGLGEVSAALDAYTQGVNRIPAPTLLERESAVGGAARMVQAKGLFPDTLREIEKVLGVSHN